MRAMCEGVCVRERKREREREREGERTREREKERVEGWGERDHCVGTCERYGGEEFAKVR